MRFPLLLRNVEDLPHARGIDVSHEPVRFWWNRSGPAVTSESRRSGTLRRRAHSNWQWHLDEVFLNVGGERHDMWRAVDHGGEGLEAFVNRRRDRKAALKFLGKPMKRHDGPEAIVAARLRARSAAGQQIGNADQG